MKRRTWKRQHARALREVRSFERPINALSHHEIESRATYMWKQGYDAAVRDLRKDTSWCVGRVLKAGWRVTPK